MRRGAAPPSGWLELEADLAEASDASADDGKGPSPGVFVPEGADPSPEPGGIERSWMRSEVGALDKWLGPGAVGAGHHDDVQAVDPAARSGEPAGDLRVVGAAEPVDR